MYQIEQSNFHTDLEVYDIDKNQYNLEKSKYQIYIFASNHLGKNLPQADPPIAVTFWTWLPSALGTSGTPSTSSYQ